MLKKILIAGLGLLLVNMPGKAAVVALWDFENGDTTSPFTPSSGTQAGSATLTGTGTIVSHSGNNVLSFADAGSFVIQVSGSGLIDFTFTYSVSEGSGGSAS